MSASDKAKKSQAVTAQSTTVSSFEAIKHVNEAGEEFWYVRELALLLGYGTGWRNFERVIDEAREVCTASGGDVDRLFDAIVKKSRGRDAADYRLTRHACYIVAESV